ncbi:MAG TPA: SpoIIE family protein phosphatase [Bacteroidia bacterium]|nr:SpoIIE family protein phosphatase [Bacteroidia bacterium]
MITAVIISGIIALACAGFSVYALLSRNRMRSAFDGLNKQINNYQSIIDQANDAMIVIDIVDGRIHQSNPGAAQLLGYSQEELSKKSLFDLHPKEDLERSSMIVADVWEKGGLIYKDIPFVTKSGEILPVECSAKVAPFAGRPAIVIYARDIRERLKLEGEIQLQKNIIEQKNKDITDSINYAKRIQEAILPTEEQMKEVAPDHFVFYRPKDIVSGDFYWATSVTTTDPSRPDQKKYSLIAAIDCTGHGVPGAFMSIVGHTILEQTITDPDVNSPAQALDFLNRGVIKTLKQKANDDFSVKDGMDMAFCAIDPEKRILNFAGANNPVYIIRGGQLIELSGDKQPIGAYMKDVAPFTDKSFQLEKGDCIYIFTDGIADQFGGPKGKKFKYKQLQQLLVNIHSQNMDQQKKTIVKTVEDWMSFPTPSGGTFEQTDDMLIIGVRVS